jgi:hypothetical protein
MKSWPKWARWAWILPAAELLLAASVVLPRIVHMMRNPPHISRSNDDRIITDLRDPRWQLLLEEGGPRFPTRFESIAWLNLPGILVEIPLSLPTTWPDSYFPHWAWPIDLDGFRALSWPVWALPFWFGAGRGLDNLEGYGNITAAEAFLMGLLSVAMALCAIAASLAGSDPSLHPPYERWALLPIAMWFTFGAICQLAWWRQRRHTRSSKRGTVIQG